MKMTNEIIYNKNIFGKVIITFKNKYKYSCSIDWKTPHTPVTRIKRGAIDVTDEGYPFEISEDQVLTINDNFPIQFYSIEAVSVFGIYSYLELDQNYKLKRLNCPDRGFHADYNVKDSIRYKEAASSKIYSILKDSLAAFAIGIDRDCNPVSLIFLNGYIYKWF